MGKYEDCPQDLNLWKSCEICKRIGCREDYTWDDVLTILASKITFDELHDYVRKNPLPFLDCHIDENLSETDRDHLDLIALCTVSLSLFAGLERILRRFSIFAEEPC